MEFEIEFYKDNSGNNPIEEFLLELSGSNLKLVLKARQEIDKLRNRIYHREPFSKHIEPGLWELRVKSSTDILRIFYSFEKGRIIILLHVFIKKKQKTSVKELEIARKRLKEVRRIES